MAGLILAFPLWVCCMPLAQDANDLESLHSSRLTKLLSNPRNDWYFVNTVFQSVTRLEHHHRDLSLRAWQFLNQPVSDAAISNILVFSRRNQLPLPEVTVAEGANSILERALYLWGKQQIGQADQLLASAENKFADDLRFKNNRAWISMLPPSQLAATAASRELCQAVLAFKRPLH
ncbi:MAG: hypothetical protein H8E25_09130 [Planctomycetes bacterium]|nr:hypothetical protein [Planctomycetota bacterium]